LAGIAKQLSPQHIKSAQCAAVQHFAAFFARDVVAGIILKERRNFR